MNDWADLVLLSPSLPFHPIPHAHLQDVMNARDRALAEGWKLDPDDAKSCKAFAIAHPEAVLFHQAQDLPNKKARVAK